MPFSLSLNTLIDSFLWLFFCVLDSRVTAECDIFMFTGASPENGATANQFVLDPCGSTVDIDIATTSLMPFAVLNLFLTSLDAFAYAMTVDSAMAKHFISGHVESMLNEQFLQRFLSFLKKKPKASPTSVTSRRYVRAGVELMTAWEFAGSIPLEYISIFNDMKILKENTVDPPPKEVCFEGKCNGQSFENLESHHESAHAEIECAACEMLFFGTRSLNKHMKKVHFYFRGE